MECLQKRNFKATPATVHDQNVMLDDKLENLNPAESKDEKNINNKINDDTSLSKNMKNCPDSRTVRKKNYIKYKAGLTFSSLSSSITF